MRNIAILVMLAACGGTETTGPDARVATDAELRELAPCEWTDLSAGTECEAPCRPDRPSDRPAEGRCFARNEFGQVDYGDFWTWHGRRGFCAPQTHPRPENRIVFLECD